MAIGWKAALKFIPWKDVLNSAPSVLNGAKQLWQSAQKGNAPVTPPIDLPDIASDPIGNLKIRVLQLEKARYETSTQGADTADILKALAEQQQQLVSEISRLRIYFRVLGVLVIILLMVVLKIWIWG